MLDRIFQRLRDSRGSVVVEFAFVFPMLLVLLLGITEFSRAYLYWNNLQEVAADGARYAAVNRDPTNPGSSALLEDFIKSTADAGDLQSGMGVCIEYGADEVGQPVTVRTDYTFNVIPFLDDETGVGAITLKGQATHRLEAVPDYASTC